MELDFDHPIITRMKSAYRLGRDTYEGGEVFRRVYWQHKDMGKLEATATALSNAINEMQACINEVPSLFQAEAHRPYQGFIESHKENLENWLSHTRSVIAQAKKSKDTNQPK